MSQPKGWIVLLIYLIYDGLTNPVFDSQVLTMLEFLARSGMGPDLVVSFERRGATDELLRKKNVVVARLPAEVLIVERWPFLGAASLRCLGSRLAQIIAGRIRGSGPLILHCRGHASAFVALQVRALLPYANAKVLADIRGVPEELLAYTTAWRSVLDRFRYREAKRVEHAVYASVDALCCVSHALKDYITRSSGRPSNQIAVVHCAVDTSLFRFDPTTRAMVRRELGLDDKLVFVYSGSLAPWQGPGKLLEFFSAVKQLHPPSHLVILTKETHAAERVLGRHSGDGPGVTLLSLSHREVPRYLMAADVGLLLRDDTPVNRVAFPTKYAEYLATGLFVVATQGVRDIAKYTAAYPVTGCLLRGYPTLTSQELGKLIQCLFEGNLLTDASRYERSSIADRLFSAEKLFTNYLEVYSALAHG